MNLPDTNIHSRFRIAGALLIVGVIVEILSLFWIHPLAFMGFIVIGCSFLGLGSVLFLWTLISPGKDKSSP